MKSFIKPYPETMRPRFFLNIMLWLTLFILFFSMDISHADEPTVTIKKADRCPVCGMFVYKYPKWGAQISFRNGAYYFYDGAKDMFKHIFDTEKYTPGESANNIKDIYVTDYYDVELINAKTAFFVIGSDVLGPMGHELLPFKNQESAQEFLEDHKGKSIIRFQDVTPALIESLDRRT
ncbi:MAG: nitrous oxide reductase accessory protein NosL [Methylococcales bacterium]|nr:nitrous oxide reductase accessory protein NosL [Methylococcales bacterium]